MLKEYMSEKQNIQNIGKEKQMKNERQHTKTARIFPCCLSLITDIELMLLRDNGELHHEVLVSHNELTHHTDRHSLQCCHLHCT